MKKLASLILLSLFASVGYAEQISESQAEQIARKYLQGSTTSIKALKTVNTTANNAEYYIFNNGNNNGFAIISGDDEMTELVGYSDSGSFEINEETPENILNWLEKYSQYVKAVRQDKATPLKQMVSALGTPIVPSFIETRWNQRAPYNYNCSVDPVADRRCPSGCVATAMAQVMYYWQWPDVGVGSNSYESDYGVLSADFSKSVYDWKNMKKTYDVYQNENGDWFGNWTVDEGNAVAKLMSDIGIATNMGYTASSSGTLDVYMHKAAAVNFKYDSQMYARGCMSDQDFMGIIKDALNNKKPLLMSGASSGGGHEFVIDGYDSNDFVHVNWGWGGNSDGYFDVNYMNPSDLGTGGGTGGGYNEDQHLILITPNKTNDAKYSQFILSMIDTDDQLDVVGYVKALQPSVTKGQTLKVAVLGIWNGGIEYDGNISLGVYDMKGNRVAVGKHSQYYKITSGLYFNYDLFFSLKSELADLPDGKYQIYVVSKEKREGSDFDWIRINSQEHQDIEVKGNVITTGQAGTDFLEVTTPFNVEIKNGSNIINLEDDIVITFNMSNRSQTNRARGNYMVHFYEYGATYPTVYYQGSCNISPRGYQNQTWTLTLKEEYGFKNNQKYQFKVAPVFESTIASSKFVIAENPEFECIITIGEDAGVEGTVADNSIKVYPNPATDRVVVETEAEVISVSVYALDGQLVQKVGSQKELNVSDIPAGHYIVSVQTKQGIINQQIIKK